MINERAKYSGILLTLPFVAVWAASLAGFYPYVGSRHTAFLFPFAIAAVSFPLAAVYGQKLWATALLAALLVTASNTSGKTFEPYITKENQSRALMTEALNYMRQSIPRTDAILTDYQSGLMAIYYFCGPREIVPIDTFSGSYFTIECNGHSIVASRTWLVKPDAFPAEFEKIALAAGMKPGDKVWVFQAGWGVELARKLPWISPEFRCLASKSFGKNIAVIPFVVSPDLHPAATVTNCPPPAFNSFIE